MNDKDTTVNRRCIMGSGPCAGCVMREYCYSSVVKEAIRETKRRTALNKQERKEAV